MVDLYPSVLTWFTLALRSLGEGGPSIAKATEGETVRILGTDGSLLAVGEMEEDGGRIQPRVVLIRPP